MKKWLAFLLATAMLFCTLACSAPEPPETPDTPDTPAAPETTENEIDLYLIAGQSNAAGHTKVKNANALYAAAPELKDGYSHVLYAGNARRDNGTKAIDNIKEWAPARIGLGIDRDEWLYIGPEAGMAAGLSEYYNEESGKYAGIIKMAHGGTGLLDNRTGSNRFGNWMPPSYAKERDIAWENDDVTGVLYRELLKTVREQVLALRTYGKGFTKVNLKGFYWMQGCHNRNVPNEYRLAFIMFMEDLRADLSELMIELTGEDCGAATLPVFVGTISETFSLQSADTYRTVNRPFIRMQKELPKAVQNCYVVDNSQYAIGRWDELENTLVVLGSDGAHWNQDDMLQIGKNVAEMMLEKCLGYTG
ncbi:MAG: hypothetical protein IJY22_02755 [Clostridia bacterium]|nr:hypothetical protein [Clostridia bacterium]